MYFLVIVESINDYSEIFNRYVYVHQVLQKSIVQLVRSRTVQYYQAHPLDGQQG